MSLTAILDAIISTRTPVFFAGSHKNSGKTTALVSVCEALRARGERCALLTTGRDGEASDALFGNEKPRVRVEKGEFFLTTPEGLSGLPPASLHWNGDTAAGGRGRLAICEAAQDGDVELHGPRDKAGVWRAIMAMQRCAPAHKTLVDGALDRWAALDGGPCAVVLVVGARALDTPEKAARHLAHRMTLMSLPVHPEVDMEISHDVEPDEALKGRTPLIRGAVTEDRLQAVLAFEPRLVVVPSPVHLFVSEGFLSRNAERIGVLSAPSLLGIMINAFHSTEYPPGAFYDAVRGVAGTFPVADVLSFP